MIYLFDFFSILISHLFKQYLTANNIQNYWIHVFIYLLILHTGWHIIKLVIKHNVIRFKIGCLTVNEFVNPYFYSMITWMYRKDVTSSVRFVPTFSQIHPNHNQYLWLHESDTSFVRVSGDYPSHRHGVDSSLINMTLFGVEI